MMDQSSNPRIRISPTGGQKLPGEKNQSLGNLFESPGTLISKIRQSAREAVGQLAQRVGVGGSQPSTSFDGQFITAHGTMCDPSTPLAEVPPFQSKNPKAGAATIILINGIDCNQQEAMRLAGTTAKQTGHPVVPLFNQTLGGRTRDVFKVFLNKAGIASTPVVSVVRDLVVNAVLTDKELFLGAHSHGAIVASTAIARAKKDLTELYGLDSTEIEVTLSKLIRIETYAGAATKYPDGPRYIHFVDEGDPIAWWLGVARHELPPDEIAAKSKSIELFNPRLALQFKLLGQNTQELIEPGRGAQILRLPHDHHRTFKVAHSLINHLAVRDRLLTALEGT